MKSKLIMAAVCFSLAACGSEPETKADEEAKRTRLENTISTQLDAMEKAENVEQKLLDDVEKRKQQIDDGG